MYNKIQILTILKMVLIKTETYEGEDRRSEPRTGKIEDVTAGQVEGAKSRVSNLAVEGKRTDLGATLDGMKFTEGTDMMAEVRTGLADSLKPKSPYLQNLQIPKGNLDAQARSFIEQRFAQSASGLYIPESFQQEGDLVAPTPEQMIAMLKGLYTKQDVESLREMLDTGMMKEPTVVLEPEVEFARLRAQLDGQTDPYKTYVSDSRLAEFEKDDKALGRTDKVIRWNIGVGEGKQELDGQSGLLRDLIAQFSRTKKPRVNVPTQSVYAAMQADAIRKGKPLDVVNWSVLRSGRLQDIKREDDPLVSGGGFGVVYVDFFGDDPGDRCDGARFRPVLMAKKLNT